MFQHGDVELICHFRLTMYKPTPPQNGQRVVKQYDKSQQWWAILTQLPGQSEAEPTPNEAKVETEIGTDGQSTPYCNMGSISASSTNDRQHWRMHISVNMNGPLLQVESMLDKASPVKLAVLRRKRKRRVRQDRCDRLLANKNEYKWVWVHPITVTLHKKTVCNCCWLQGNNFCCMVSKPVSKVWYRKYSPKPYSQVWVYL